tara:strand:+ start:5750 stop:7441 length:1692 start_codon:yes stop_codon:yes gene_type:complete
MRLLFLFITIIITFSINAQFPKFEIGGLARSLSQSSHLDEQDTVNNDVSQDFNIVFDLAIKGSLNKYVSLYSELRMGSNLEVFDTSSSYLNLRRLLIFGDLNKSFSFEIGDIDLKMTPFTLWNSVQEGNVNENLLFSNYRNIQNYENFNNENFWRRQGASLFGNKPLSKRDTLNYKIFGTRELSSNEISIPDVFIYGGNITFFNKSFSLGVNHVDLFTNNKGISLDTNLHNHVVSSKSSFKFNKLELTSEFGISKRTNHFSSNNKWIDGEFISFDFKTNFSKNLVFTLNYRSVSDDFSSPGAQTKRINHSMAPNLFPLVGNSSNNREIIASDIVSDISFFSSTSFYNRNIDYSLDRFNPIFGVSEPYGISTPNRQGISSMIEYSDSSNIFYIQGKVSLLNDFIGEGVLEKRKYLSYLLSSNIFINKLLGFDKVILINGGFNYSNAKRNHSPEIFVQNVDFNNSVLDLGLDIELIKNLHLLYGYKSINAQGIDYISIRDDNFTITSFQKFEINTNQNVSSVGLKYDFTKKSSLIMNYQNIRCDYENSDLSFIINQFFILAQIKF